MTASRLRLLQDLCGGRAEAEVGFLTEAFVLAKDYENVLHAPFHSPILLVGRKGSGKSALLRFIDLKASVSGVKSLYIKPDDIPLLDGVGDATDTATIKRKAYEAILTAIAVKVGAEMRGMLNRKDKKLFDKAIREGARSRDTVQACLQALARVGSIVRGIDFMSLVPDTEDCSHRELRASLQATFTQADRAFFLLLDDVDQVAALENPDQVNRIWGLILATQKLTEELPNFKTIISLRTEIWTLLANDKHGQRDQVDHVRPLVRRLDPGEDDIKAIVERRLKVARNRLAIASTESPIDVFFDQRFVTLPTTEESRRHWPDFFATTSRGRPRDALQLLGLLAEESRNAGYQRVSQEVVEHATGKYSSQRVDDLVHEYGRDCQVVREVCDSFASLDFMLSTDDLREHLVSLPSRFSVRIRGIQLRPDVLSDTFLLWSFIYEMGICSPRIPDNRQERGFRHVHYDDNPNFVSEANWNEMQKVGWEIHPAYRLHLIQKRAGDEARSGISLASFFTRNKKGRK